MICVRNIQRSFDKLQVLKGIDLDIARGEIVSIVGPSGAGKTTLLQIMGSLDRPDCGSVSYDGESLFDMSENRLARFRNSNIGFVFQFHQLLPEFTLVENVAMPALIAGRDRARSFDEAAVLLERLGLADRATHRPAELSGGECQRAAVARALINKPKIVLADEPSGSLDSHNRAELHRLFFSLRDSMEATFVIVTHDEGLAKDSDTVIRMADGRIEDVVNN